MVNTTVNNTAVTAISRNIYSTFSSVTAPPNHFTGRYTLPVLSVISEILLSTSSVLLFLSISSIKNLEPKHSPMNIMVSTVCAMVLFLNPEPSLAVRKPMNAAPSMGIIGCISESITHRGYTAKDGFA